MSADGDFMREMRDMQQNIRCVLADENLDAWVLAEFIVNCADQVRASERERNNRLWGY